MASRQGLNLMIHKFKRIIFRTAKYDRNNYNKWIKNKLKLTALSEDYKNTILSLNNHPRISIIIPVYNPPIKFLDDAIKSIIDQLYTNWELCIADDNSSNPEVSKLLQEYSTKDARIKVTYRDSNGHISNCSNSAINLATGSFLIFMDHDDLLTINCLFEIVKHINEHPDIELIYSDEDKINDDGQFSTPHFKPDWAPHNLLSRNYIGHVVAMTKKLVDSIGGLRVGFEGSQDYDLLLRATEITDKIGHIPKVLYHWRIHKESVSFNDNAKPYANLAAIKALEEALVRRGTPGKVENIHDLSWTYRITYEIIHPGKVSIIIPSKDHAKLLRTTLESIISKTKYSDYEIILLNNNSTSNEFFDLVDEFKKKHGNIFTCYDANFSFNFSKLINMGVEKSKGKYLLFLNNDIKIINDNWMDVMVSYAQHENVGAVGVKLLFPNNTIQHAGVILGLGGAAGHVFVNFQRWQSSYFNYILSLNNYSALTAACMMCRRDAFDKVQGFDEKLAVEYNDIDFCIKLLDNGLYNVYVPEVELYHFESSTRSHPYHSKEAFVQHQIDINIFRSKWINYINNDPFYNPNLSIENIDFRINFKS